MKYYILSIFIFVTSSFITSQTSTKQIDIKNGFKDFKLNSDISLYKDIISKASYVAKFKNNASINQTIEYKNVSSAQANVMFSENCQVWVYQGSNRKIGDSYINSLIIFTFQNKIINIHVDYARSDETDDAVVSFYGKYTVPEEPNIPKLDLGGESCIKTTRRLWQGKIASLDMNIITSTYKCTSNPDIRDNWTNLYFVCEPLKNLLIKYVQTQYKSKNEKIKKDL